MDGNGLKGRGLGGRTRANSLCFTKNWVEIGAFRNAKIWKNLSMDQSPTFEFGLDFEFEFEFELDFELKIELNAKKYKIKKKVKIKIEEEGIICKLQKTISVLKRKSGGVTRGARCVTVTLPTRFSCVTHG